MNSVCKYSCWYEKNHVYREGNCEYDYHVRLKQVHVSVGEIPELGFLPRQGQDAHILLTASETKYCLLRLHWKEKTMGGTTEQLQNALPPCFQHCVSPGSCLLLLLLPGERPQLKTAYICSLY